MHIVITGGANGLGRTIADNFRIHDWDVTIWDIANGIDVSSPAVVSDAAAAVKQVDVLVNCAGINHIDWFEELDTSVLEKVMAVNAFGIINCTRALLPKLYGGGTVCNITSNAAHMPMTASLAYNASKAAAEMITKQMAHELGPRHGVTVFAVAPNKLANTGMSAYTAARVAQVRGWTANKVQERQLATLPAHEETPVDIIAEFITFLLLRKARHKYLQGCTINYGGP